MCNLLKYKDRMDQARATFEEISDIRINPKLNFKVAPSEPAPVLFKRDGSTVIDMMNFGFNTHRGRQMMARGETVAKLRTFRDSFKSRRCPVLVHGFYDSEDLGRHAPKQPWHIHLKGDGLMCFAALWESTPGADNFTIVSAPANRVVARVIDRMPVILPQEQWRAWMDEKADPETLLPLLRPFPEELMEAYPVTKMVNQKGFNGPECEVPIALEQPDLGLF